jgi:hypothetical protein
MPLWAGVHFPEFVRRRDRRLGAIGGEFRIAGSTSNLMIRCGVASGVSPPTPRDDRENV